MTAQPRLRDDLVIQLHATRHGKSVVVKDPKARRFFRFGAVEHFIAQQLDGATPLETVRSRVEERFGQPLSGQTLSQFVEQFRRFRLLDDGSSIRHEPDRQRVRGSLFYIRVKAFDPDRLLNWLVPRIRWVFTRTFMVASAATILVALAVTAAGWSQFTRDLTRLYRFDALLMAWVTVLSVITVHELAHGVTCKRFGGEVNEIGFLLLYFQPAFYCNVSDAWLIPEKSKRLWVTFAGAYSEMVVWALATLAWRVTETDTWVNFVALVIMATSAIKTLFNLNPLIKLDGYYLLSDYLEIPNLRQKSMAALRARARSVWKLSADALRIPRGDERVYLAFGALAVLYSTWLMTLIAWRLGAFLIIRYRGAGFSVFAALLLIAFRRPLRTALAGVTRTADGPSSVKPRHQGLRRLAVGAALLAVMAAIPTELKVAGNFRILPTHTGEIRTQIDGIVADIYKDEGDHVERGEPIARLDDREYASELQKVDAQIAQAEARRDLLARGPRREEIELARSERDSARVRRQHGEQMYDDASRFRAAESAKLQTSIEKAEQRLSFARNDLERVQRLFASALIPRKTVDEAEHELTVRGKELEEARAAATMAQSDDSADARKERDIAAQELSRAEGRLRVLMAGSAPEDLKAAEAEITRLRAERTHLEQQLQLAQIVSHTAGVIATPKLKDRIGERVGRGDLIANVYDQNVVAAEIMVSEKEIADVRVGQSIVAKARAFPDRTFATRVTAVAPIAVEDPGGLGGRMVRVMTEVDNRERLLKPEMTGTAKIYCGRGRVFDMAMRRLARYVRVEFWSWW